jgi:predicted transcriptional regulator
MFTPERRTLNRYMREEIKVDNKHILDTMRWLTERDISILKLLLDKPFLTTSQIEMMVFSDLKPSSWRTKANERLRRLYKAYLVDRWYPPVPKGAGSPQSHYVLDSAGSRVLAMKGHKEADAYRKRTYIPQTYQHSLKLYDFEAMMKVLAKQTGGELMNWRLESRNKIKFKPKEGKESCIIPDAFCVFRTEKIKFFFLECDNATMDREQLQSKIKRYIDCYEGEEWKQTDWAKVFKRFPPVIIVMHTQEDVRKLRSYIKTLKTNIRFLLTTYDELIECDYIVYESRGGKRREVLQEMRVRLFEDIFLDNKEKGRVVL